MSRQADIQFKITLDEKNIPAVIEWDASDAPEPGLKQCDAIMLSIWDSENHNTLSIDLWTRAMTIDEMNFFVLQTLMKLSDTYRKATQNDSIADLLDGFAKTLTTRLEEDAASKKGEDAAGST